MYQIVTIYQLRTHRIFWFVSAKIQHLSKRCKFFGMFYLFPPCLGPYRRCVIGAFVSMGYFKSPPMLPRISEVTEVTEIHREGSRHGGEDRQITPACIYQIKFHGSCPLEGAPVKCSYPPDGVPRSTVNSQGAIAATNIPVRNSNSAICCETHFRPFPLICFAS